MQHAPAPVQANAPAHLPSKAHLPSTAHLPTTAPTRPTVVPVRAQSSSPTPAPTFLKPRIKRGITSDECRAMKSLMRFVACTMQVFGEDTEGHYIYDRHNRVAFRMDRYVDAVEGALQFNREHYTNQVKAGNPKGEDLRCYASIVRRRAQSSQMRAQLQ